MATPDYLTAAINAAADSTGNFNSSQSRVLSLEKEEKEKEIIPIIPEEIPDLNLPGIPNVQALGKDLIQQSDMNNILDYNNFQLLVANITAENRKEIGSNWASIPNNKSYFHPNLLKHSYNICNILVRGRNNNHIEWDGITLEMIKIFKIVVSLNIKSRNEVSLYSILTANQTLFDANPGSKIELFDNTFWEMFLIPVMLKQDQLLGIKFVEFWMYLGADFNKLFQEVLSTEN